MAERIGSVWAIDLGNDSLKALRLSNESGTLEVIGFENIPHGKILTGTGVKDTERDELIALSLRQFAQQNDLGKDDVIVSVPSQNSFARFVNLPPVEQKRIPEIVKFEASQQIPFDINDVQWDWQLMSSPDNPEAKVGIFAIKNDVVAAELEHFSRENIQVQYVQIAPMALYNFLLYDRPELTRSDTQATVVINIGAESTDLVVCTKSAVWQRTIPMGGNAFTKAIADTFKLSFEKAEKLKRTAPMSKYARQILQAMKPVFADLASEIQRSLGFFAGSNPNTKLTKIVAFGGGTKMRGLLQYLQQSLQIPIERPDSFKHLALNSAVSAAKFHESVCDFGIVYGLALQGLGLGRIESNLLPRNIARSMAWSAKSKYFIAAASLVLVASVLALASTVVARTGYNSKQEIRQAVKAIIEKARRTGNELSAEQNKAAGFEAAIKKHFDLFKYRQAVPQLYQTIISVLPNEKNNPGQAELYRAFASRDVETIMEKFEERKERKQIFITGMSVYYTNDLENSEFGASDFERGVEPGTETPSGPSMLEQQQAMMRALYGLGEQSKFAPPPGTSLMPGGAGGGTAAAGEPGFVVTIAGYSPYKNIDDLIDPASVQDDQTKWGLVTRLLNIDSFFDGNSPFELYKKMDRKHFDLKTGDVDLVGELPRGVGIKSTTVSRGDGQQAEHVLIDPMTKEIISKVPAVDETGKKKTDRSGKVEYDVKDHWFVLNVKFKWKESPKPAVAGSGAAAAGAVQPASTPAAAPSAAPATKPATTKKATSGKSDKMKDVDL
jgi:type IV pilus assembly protein PilM